MFNNIYKNRTVLLTGDTGFKGSWLAIWLKTLGANVVGVSLPPKTVKDNYVICGLNKKIEHIDQDIRDYDKISKLFKYYKPEIVFHLAAQSLVLESYKNPLRTYSTNIMGTANVMESIRHAKTVKAAVIVTSDKCYENKECLHGYREDDRLGGKDPYSSSKAACELAINSYIQSFFSDKNTTNIASVRAGNVVGGGDWAENRIFPDCIRALEKGKPIIVRNPNATRPWQYVLEPLSGYLKICSLLYTNGKNFVGAWNFGPSTKDIVTVKDFVEKIIRQWGKGEMLISDQSCQYPEANFLHLDITKAINKLQWEPILDIKETIKYTIDEYKIGEFSVDKVYQQRIEHIRIFSELR